uniref:Uncharacterized protein n=1 Tax=Rhizophora mucronata TaxID=61149 RepID=A0A2P2Q0P7_RHIMU
MSALTTAKSTLENNVSKFLTTKPNTKRKFIEIRC